ncbi:hypothetical protein M8C21_016729 [Ambrosia artemisiifolia]|uniref:Uncharacterized protein n=1 Tax=Ambrosia artemisiifolia TaxID=4212 RepID=A0AAD5CT99_AMBAR|nr:hypothetical protein M8C21_016729 [Ambrosia artemisiifolia]
MASISTCLKITPTSYSNPKPSSLIFSRQFHFSPRAHNNIFRTHFFTLRNRNNNIIIDSRSYVSEIRAGYDVPSVVATEIVNRPGRKIESDKLTMEVRRRTMEAVDKCGRRVTVGDVAGMAGIKLIEAQRALQAIAADTNGFLEVSDEGDILYMFREDYRSKLASKSLWIKTEPLLEKLKSSAEYLVRVTFGTALIASILIVFTTIIAILTSSRFWDPYYHRRQFQNEHRGMRFILPVYSFVFGDGDPNEGIEEQRWKMGNILYQFPSLQRTAASKKRSKKELQKKFKERVGGPHKFLKENKWVLSKTSKKERAVIGGLGALNLFGVIALSAMLRAVKIVEPGPFILFVYKILPLLQFYAVSFFAIPSARWFLIQKRNAEIEKRNRARELHAQALQLPDVALKQKILSAQDMSEKTVIDQYRIVYTTDKDVSEQDYDKHEWDMRFKDTKYPVNYILGGATMVPTKRDLLLIRVLQHRRSLVSQSRAGYNAPSVVNRPGRIIESDKLTTESGAEYLIRVFSFVFGDGDPNEDIEEQRWKMIGQYIGSNDGVVTAEELAPYLDVETAVKTDDDSYILPVLLRFDGQPLVDKEGNILYQFPSLQRTAASKKRSKEELEKKFKERVGGPHKFFKENKWELSKTSDKERAVIGGLGALNLFGVIVLSAMLKRNAEIVKRNWARELRAQALQLPDVALKRKWKTGIDFCIPPRPKL